MKIITFAMFQPDKAAEVAEAVDKAANAPGMKRIAQYVFQGNPFPQTVPPMSMVAISISAVESNEALAAANYPLGLAGASNWAVPVLEMPESGAAETEKQYRG
jgi:hypothetical protein